jgi:hypothetical protein
MRKDPHVMTNGFAGAKSLDERRRRRLAREGTDAGVEPSRASRGRSRSSDAPQAAKSAQAENSLQLPASPVRSRLWREPWKHALLIAALLLVNIGLVLHANWSVLRPGSPAATSAIESWLVEHLAIGYFALTTRFAWLIYRHRSRSKLDFAGRYRLWILPALFWTGVFACSMTGWHQSIGETLAGQTNIPLSIGSRLCWLIPAAAILLFMTRLLKSEYSVSRLSWRLHLSSVAVAAIAVGCGLLHGTPLDGVWRSPAFTLGMILWPTLEFGSFLLFARHIVHVTNDPIPCVTRPRKRLISGGEVFTKLLTWLRASRRKPAKKAWKTYKPPRNWTVTRPAKSQPEPAEKTRTGAKTRGVKSINEDESHEDADGVENMPVSEKTAATAPIPSREPQSAKPIGADVKPAITPPPAPPKPATVPPRQEAVQTPRAEVVSKPAESKSSSKLRFDQPQANRGPHFAQANQQREREAVAAARRDESRTEDDFGDVDDDWDADESEAPRRKRMKGKKKRRR